MIGARAEKLVRDKIPLMPDPRFGGSFRQAAPEELRNLLCQKLTEEVGELRRANNAEEAADVKEVILAITKRFKFDVMLARKLRRKKIFGRPYQELLEGLVLITARFVDDQSIGNYADLIDVGTYISRSSTVFTPNRIEEIRKQKFVQKGGFDGGWVWIPPSPADMS